jgi:hypothetical protein
MIERGRNSAKRPTDLSDIVQNNEVLSLWASASLRRGSTGRSIFAARLAQDEQ